jgi:hypothetical protein
MHDRYDSFFIRCLALSTILVCIPVIAALMTVKLFISILSMALLLLGTLFYMFMTGAFGLAVGIVRPLLEDTFSPQIFDHWKEDEQRDFFIWCFVLGILAGGAFGINFILGLMVTFIVAFAITEMADGWMTILKKRHQQAVLDKKMEEVKKSVWLPGL